MTGLRHAVILGSVRDGRFGDKPATWLCDLAKDRERATYEMIDLRDHPLPPFGDKTLPGHGASETEAGREWRALLGGLDALVFITAEYNHGITGVLKNALDYAYPELNRKPAGFLGYGGVGAARAVEQLRLVLIEMQVAPVRDAVHITMPDFAELSAGRKQLEDLGYLRDSAILMLDQVEWWSAALRAARDGSGK